MKFEFIGNACGIFYGSKGTKLLCDPWIENGVFDGSWFHYPPLETSFKDIQNIDLIYLSHIHQDHYDDRFFDFPKDTPIVVLDDKFNFLIGNLERKGYTNLLKIRDGETLKFREFKITLYAPFAKNNFFDAGIGNLIDSAMVIENDQTIVNFNDNTPTPEACKILKKKFKKFDLAMINYNAAGPYPSCFKNLSYEEKINSHNNIISRNLNYMASLINILTPSRVLPFAGSYVIGGFLAYKNEYLGTITWDECREYLHNKVKNSIEVICLRDKDIFDLETGKSNNPYVPIDKAHMLKYINKISGSIYPYEKDQYPEINRLMHDIKIASRNMEERINNIGIKLTTSIAIDINKKEVLIFKPENPSQKLVCYIDLRLLRRILDRLSHWNNAEIGCHIDFFRTPNNYEPDVHNALQFFHI